MEWVCAAFYQWQRTLLAHGPGDTVSRRQFNEDLASWLSFGGQARPGKTRIETIVRTGEGQGLWARIPHKGRLPAKVMLLDPQTCLCPLCGGEHERAVAFNRAGRTRTREMALAWQSVRNRLPTDRGSAEMSWDALKRRQYPVD